MSIPVYADSRKESCEFCKFYEAKSGVRGICWVSRAKNVWRDWTCGERKEKETK